MSAGVNARGERISAMRVAGGALEAAKRFASACGRLARER
jgi:hypothetical protein